MYSKRALWVWCIHKISKACFSPTCVGADGIMERKDYSSKTTYCLALFDGFLLAYFPPSCFMRSQLGSQGGGNNNLQRRHIALHSLMVFYSLIFPLHVSWDPRWDRRGEKILIYKDDILFFLSDGFLLADFIYFPPACFMRYKMGSQGEWK